MQIKMITSPKWIGATIKTIIPIAVFVWGIFAYTIGWFNATNAAVKSYPKLEERIIKVETAQIEYNANFNTFLEMYKLEILGRKKEAQDLARSIPSNNP